MSLDSRKKKREQGGGCGPSTGKEKVAGMRAIQNRENSL